MFKKGDRVKINGELISGAFPKYVDRVGVVTRNPRNLDKVCVLFEGRTSSDYWNADFIVKA